MKKEYSKPLLYAEKFELVEHIANCNVPNGDFSGANNTSNNIDNCSYDIGGAVLFKNYDNCADFWMFSDAGVTPSLEAARDLNVQCYNSFFDPGYTLFSS